MKGRIQWLGNVMFVAESGSGHALVLDGAPEGGGRNMGMRPMELMLLSVGACSAYDIVTMLRKARQAVTGCECELRGERADGVPAVFEAIQLRFRVSGHGLSERQVARAVQLSAEKYCSASIMLARAGVKLSHDFEIIAAESGHGGDGGT